MPKAIHSPKTICHLSLRSHLFSPTSPPLFPAHQHPPILIINMTNRTEPNRTQILHHQHPPSTSVRFFWQFSPSVVVDGGGGASDVGIVAKKKKLRKKIRSSWGPGRRGNRRTKPLRDDPADWALKRQQAMAKAKNLKCERERGEVMHTTQQAQASASEEMGKMIRRYDLSGNYKMPFPTPPQTSKPSNARRRPQSASSAENLGELGTRKTASAGRPKSAAPEGSCRTGNSPLVPPTVDIAGHLMAVPVPSGDGNGDMALVHSAEWAKQLKLVINLVKSDTPLSPVARR
jgi:hypothetical protein